MCAEKVGFGSAFRQFAQQEPYGDASAVYHECPLAAIELDSPTIAQARVNR